MKIQTIEKSLSLAAAIAAIISASIMCKQLITPPTPTTLFVPDAEASTQPCQSSTN